MFRATDFLGKCSKPSRIGSLLSKIRHQSRDTRAVQAYEPNVDRYHINGEYAKVDWCELGNKESSLSLCKSFALSPSPQRQTMLPASDCFKRIHTKASPQSAMNDCELSNDHSDVVEEYANLKWDELGFCLIPVDYMYVMKCSKEKNFSHGILTRFGRLEMNPSSGILNYGQGVFEGLKAYRTEDGRILLFRPEQNALRMQMGADRLRMPSPTIEQFVDAVKHTVVANKQWVPPPGKGSLYIRPLLMGSGPVLGATPAPDYTFLAFASPVGNYHKGYLNLVVEEKFYRAFPGGTGGVKAIVNYSTVFKPVAEAKAKGFSDVLFLDVKTAKYIEEVSTSNIFFLKGNVISTPATDGTILPGITRKSVIEIAQILGYQVEERAVAVEELFDSEEVFCTGTAMVVNPVNSITYQGKRIEYKTGPETVAQKLYEMLVGIQTGRIEDKMGWTVELN
ncbi:Branched-chain-amino-acid aminotransferase 2 [Citrus sinensis]|uniref:Branched-chain-amino-acid aminotransferase 2 n=1 Tax=Citrus sinensis TaxID=2711 RepID=A0ACB8ID87_CITSI|nr:Branched-chain-amino-acid aminotransferase 2 [Citrus sinensis]